MIKIIKLKWLVEAGCLGLISVEFDGINLFITLVKFLWFFLTSSALAKFVVMLNSTDTIMAKNKIILIHILLFKIGIMDNYALSHFEY
jgi:hypothetical protein